MVFFALLTGVVGNFSAGSPVSGILPLIGTILIIWPVTVVDAMSPSRAIEQKIDEDVGWHSPRYASAKRKKNLISMLNR